MIDIYIQCRVEDTVFFPMFSPKFDTSFVEEHAAFTPGIEKLDAYLVSCLGTGATYGLGSTAPPHDRQTYDGTHVCMLIDGFAEDMCKHVRKHRVIVIQRAHHMLLYES